MEITVDLAELIERGGIVLDVEGFEPSEIYSKVCSLISIPTGLSPDELCGELCAREKVLSTAVGFGFALPHPRRPIVKNESESKIVVIYPKEKLDMKAPDSRLVYCMFLILSSSTQAHLQVLGKLANLFRNVEFRKVMENKPSVKEICDCIRTLG